MENRIGEARREYADRVGKFTQEDAAKFFGVSLSTYKKWEQGKGMMNGEQLRMIAMKYDTTVDYLLEITTKSDHDVYIYDLNENEHELVDIMRSITPQGQQQLMLFARGVSSTFTKNNQVRGIEETA